MGTAAQTFLVDDNRHAKIFDRVCIRLRNTRQKVADEHAEVFVQQTLGFGGDGIENDRRFAGTGYTGKDGDFALGNAQGYVLKIVFPGPANFDILLIRLLNGTFLRSTKAEFFIGVVPAKLLPLYMEYNGISNPEIRYSRHTCKNRSLDGQGSTFNEKGLSLCHLMTEGKPPNRQNWTCGSLPAVPRAYPLQGSRKFPFPLPLHYKIRVTVLSTRFRAV